MSDNVLSAFERLLTEIQTARKQLADEIRQAYLTSGADEAQRLLQRGKRMEAIVSDLEALRQRWRLLDEPELAIKGGEKDGAWDDSETDSPPDDDEIDVSTAKDMFGKPPRPPRIKRGLCTPQKDYRIPILQVLVEMDGRGKVRDVLSRVFAKMKEQLRKEDLERVATGEKRWYTNAQFERFKMVKEGLLNPKSPRGEWEITSMGRAYLDEYRSALKGGETNDSDS